MSLENMKAGKIHSLIHCKFLNARFECNEIVIFIYSHYHLDPNANTKCTGKADEVHFQM